MTVESDLERRIVDAFNERARSLPASSSWAPMSPLRDHPARRPSRVLVLALVTLVVMGAAGAFAMMRRSGGTPGSVESGGSGAARYRSTATVRIAPESSAATPDLSLTRPVRLALSPAVRKLALRHSRVDPRGASVTFVASENVRQSVVTLAATAPTAALATSVARSWANAFATAGRVDQRNAALALVRGVDQQLTTLNRQLATIDTDLARLLPAIYRNVLRYDEPTGPSPDDGGSAASVKGPPPVPEQGTPHELNLAFERIQLLSARSKAEAKRASLRFNALVPSAIQVVSLTPATRVEVSK
jgi:hypothetical protein